MRCFIKNALNKKNAFQYAYVCVGAKIDNLKNGYYDLLGFAALWMNYSLPRLYLATYLRTPRKNNSAFDIEPLVKNYEWSCQYLF